MLRFDSSAIAKQQQQQEKQESQSPSSSSNSDSEYDDLPESSATAAAAAVPIYEEYMSPTSSQPPQNAASETPAAVGVASGTEEGSRQLVQVLERLEKALNHQQPPAVPDTPTHPPPTKKAKSNSSNLPVSGISSAKTKKQLEEVFASVRDKLTEVSDLLK